MDRPSTPDLSIVIPVYNGAQTITTVVEQVFTVLADYQTEVILINDGSADDSEAVCQQLAQKNPNIRFISLRKNFGEHNATMCGLNYADGVHCIVIADDLQNPPEEILKVYHALQQGYDVVYTHYPHKQHRFLRNLGSRFNNLVASYLLEKPKDLYLSSFKGMHRDMVREIVRYQGPFPYVDGLILRATRNIGVVSVRHEARKHGQSNYTIGKLIQLYLNMFINFSIKPIRAVTAIGALASLAGLVLAIIIAVDALTMQTFHTGWGGLASLVLFLQGLQLVALGMLGEYLGKTYLDQNRTPQWVIKFIENDRPHPHP